MAAYGPEGLPDPYEWPGSSVLRNKWGITDGDDLAVRQSTANQAIPDSLLFLFPASPTP
jgi:hypothetical protein